MYEIKSVFFPPVNLSYTNLIFRPVKEPRREEGKCFPSLQQHDAEMGDMFS